MGAHGAERSGGLLILAGRRQDAVGIHERCCAGCGRTLSRPRTFLRTNVVGAREPVGSLTRIGLGGALRAGSNRDGGGTLQAALHAAPGPSRPPLVELRSGAVLAVDAWARWIVVGEIDPPPIVWIPPGLAALCADEHSDKQGERFSHFASQGAGKNRRWPHSSQRR